MNIKTIRFWRRFRNNYLPRPRASEEDVMATVNIMIDKGMVKRKLINNKWEYKTTKKGLKFVEGYFGKIKKLKI